MNLGIEIHLFLSVLFKLIPKVGFDRELISVPAGTAVFDIVAGKENSAGLDTSGFNAIC